MIFKIAYELNINVEKKYLEDISNILGINSMDKDNWCYRYILDNSKPYRNVVQEFLDILQGKFEKLEMYGVKRSDITIWQICDYTDQCNMEFDPHILKELGNSGIKLCISCYNYTGENPLVGTLY